MACDNNIPGIYRCTFQWECDWCRKPLLGEDQHRNLHATCESARARHHDLEKAKREDAKEAARVVAEQRRHNRWWRRLDRWLARKLLKESPTPREEGSNG